MSGSKLDFLENGFAILRDVVKAQEIENIFKQIKSVLLYVSSSVEKIENNCNQDLDQLYYKLKQDYPKLKSKAYDLIQHLDGAYKISANEKLLDFMQDLAQTPLLMDYVSIRIDDINNDRLLPFHQEFYGQISTDCYTAWVPLQDITEKSGGLRVVPGSHKLGAVKHRFYGDYHGVREEYLKDAKPLNLSLKRGDVLIFHPNLFHASTPAHENQPIRWTMVTRYNPLKNIPYIENEKNSLRIEQLEE